MLACPLSDTGLELKSAFTSAYFFKGTTPLIFSLPSRPTPLCSIHCPAVVTSCQPLTRNSLPVKKMKLSHKYSQSRTPILSFGLGTVFSWPNSAPLCVQISVAEIVIEGSNDWKIFSSSCFPSTTHSSWIYDNVPDLQLCLIAP